MEDEYRKKLIKLIESLNEEDLKLLASIIDKFSPSSSDHTYPK